MSEDSEFARFLKSQIRMRVRLMKSADDLADAYKTKGDTGMMRVAIRDFDLQLGGCNALKWALDKLLKLEKK